MARATQSTDGPTTPYLMIRLEASEHALITQASALSGSRYPASWARSILLAAATKATAKKRRAKAA